MTHGAAIARAVATFTGAAFLALAACTSSDGSGTSTSSTSGSTCPDDLPGACPSTPPSYAKDVAPAIQSSCTPCHAPGGGASDRLLTDYADAFANRGSALNQIHACRMPPRGAPPLSDANRKILLDWLVCGAPNN